ncbi:MAG: hypothetical protein R3E86_00960 [Pseudomonadales bacterium]
MGEQGFPGEGGVMELRDLFVGTMAGAAVVLMGAFYALFYALGKLNAHRLSLAASFFSCLGLVAATIVLTDALQLRGFWLLVPAAMVVGYLVAPMVIWRLSVDIHNDSDLQRDSRTQLNTGAER